MKNIKQFQGWRAEQITKVFLLNSSLFELNEYHSHVDKGYDFVAVLKEEPYKRFGIDIKATKYSKSEITRKYFSKTSVGELPLIQFFVNYDEESGYFRIVSRTRQTELKAMNRETFKQEIKNYAQHRL